MTETGDATMEVGAELLDLLACPLDYAAVRLEGSELICTTCGRRYPIENGIPNMLVEADE
ncbi:MAG: Trm112 family protein [Thermomicrobiales bacterium]